MHKSANGTALSQTDSDIIQRRDTMHMGDLPKEYATLKKQSSKNRWTKKLFSLIIREAPSLDKIDERKSMVDEFKPYEGKIIRNINITVLDPFGTDIQNPGLKSEDLDFFNDTHVLTRKSTIKNLIQFRKGTKVSPAIITASEARLRSMTYINDARISIDSIRGGNDSVDVYIIVRDKWTIGLELHRLSSSKIDIEVFDKNIVGTGSRIGLNFIYSTKYDRKFGYGGNYLYKNIANTNIDFSGSYLDKIYRHDLDLSAIRELQPKLNYFGEISYKKDIIRPGVSGWDSICPDRNEIFSITAGKAFTLSEENAIKRFVLSFRYKVESPFYRDIKYQQYIENKLVPYKYMKNRMILMQMSLYKNSYQRQYMVYNFGTTEDIAQGYNISMQLGYSNFRQIENGIYTSLKASVGSFELLKGNIYASTAISSFFNKKHAFGGVFTFDGRYFTPLMRLSKLRYRQFLTLNYSKLLDPDKYFGDRIYMGEHTTLPMRRWKEGKKGCEQLLLKSETDIFSNYEIAGFRFLFYSFFDIGWIGSKESLFKYDNLNYGLGIGIRLRNNFVILNTIDLKIGYYPKLDQRGFNNFFRIRSSTPDIPPNFVPSIPEEILLE